MLKKAVVCCVALTIRITTKMFKKMKQMKSDHDAVRECAPLSPHMRDRGGGKPSPVAELKNEKKLSVGKLMVILQDCEKLHSKDT